MKWALAVAATMAGLYVAYAIGHTDGLQSAPEHVASREALWASWDEAAAEAEANISDRELMCDRIIDDVRALLSLEYEIDAQQ